ncbi:tripartite tricarboxylate transporter substrate-binding protein [Sediminicoccus sp. BL-A-41-H5]|uniref:tripartite tricarboxylate transporter substrate-binding protein n=1 Tax=Sediminicoccus sp. BL-A-41-H5 TaxID=3421106 RepID=UPI003D6766B3
MHRRALLGAALATPALALPAAAQTVARNARIIIGFPAGGSSDIVARLYADRLRGVYAPNVIVEGRVGAAGRIAVEFVKDTDKDGTTYLQTPASMLTLQPHIFPRDVRYDALTDFIPVSTVCTFPFAFCVPMSHPARTLAEFGAWARTQPNEIPFASPAAGASPHFMGLMLAQALNIRMTHVPYRGAVPAVQDLIAGRLNAFMGVLGDVSPQNGVGLRMLAVSSAQRNPRFPDVPTFQELGFTALTKDEWFGALLPAGTPAPIVQGLFNAITQVGNTPEMRAALERLDFNVGTSASPAAFAARIRQERDEWGPIVRASGFTPE